MEATPEQHVLSIDCGTKNMGWSLWTDGQLKRWGCLTLTTATALVD
jgi:hypothetical protein